MRILNSYEVNEVSGAGFLDGFMADFNKQLNAAINKHLPDLSNLGQSIENSIKNNMDNVDLNQSCGISNIINISSGSVTSIVTGCCK